VNVIKSGIPALIIGGILLAIGLVLAGVSTLIVTKQVLEGSTIFDETPLEPNHSMSATVMGLPARQQLVLSLAGDPTDVPLQAKITGPNGDVLALYNITNTPFTSATTTELSGAHKLEIKNVGSRAVTISGALINPPIGQQGGGVGVQDNPSLQSFVAYGIGILVGIALIIAGIVLLIIGAIKYARGRKNTPPASSPPK
jgi:hypothetical protein